MKLTQRGVGAVFLAGLAMVLAAWFGPRSLNAVAAPLLGGVLVGAGLVWRADDPTVSVSPIAAGFPGQSRTVQFHLEGGGVCRVSHEWPPGLSGDPIDAIVALPATLEADVEFEGRGVYEVGLGTVRQRDPLGLVEATAAAPGSATAVVYPGVQRVTNRSALSGLFADETIVERQEFDRLREYQPGDPLRHVHWKSSAKHDEFLVTEFSPSRRTETIEIAGEATAGCDDDMASAVATVALVALRAGLSVGLCLPDETLAPGSGEAHSRNLLRALARAGHGSLAEPDIEAADIAISARPRETLLRIGSGTIMFGDVVADEAPAVPPGEVRAT